MTATTPATNAPNPFLLLIDKVVWQFVEVFLTVLITMGHFGSDVWTAALVAGISAGVTVIANGLPPVPQDLPLYVDLLYRTTRAYVAAAAGLIAAIPLERLDISTAQAAAYAAIPAALTVLKGFAASRFGARDSAALLPASADISANQFALAA